MGERKGGRRLETVTDVAHDAGRMWFRPRPNPRRDLIELMEAILSALTDMEVAVTGLETAVTAVAAEVASLKSGDDETALAALVTRVNTATTTLNGLAPVETPPSV